MQKRVGGSVKRKGIRIPTGHLSLETRYKDACYAPLAKNSQALAAEAHSDFKLDLLDGKLRCECGQMVGARKASEGDHFEPYPRPHERYKEPHKAPLKRDRGKG